MNGMTERRLTYCEYARLARLPLDKLAEQCDVQTFHATGPGGQCVNTTDSAVRTTHRESRSQYRNRQLCLSKLRDEFARRAVPPKVRHKTKPSRGQRMRRLADKRHRSQVKQLRGRVSGE
mgnify:CR=1 FL=1